MKISKKYKLTERGGIKLKQQSTVEKRSILHFVQRKTLHSNQKHSVTSQETGFPKRSIDMELTAIPLHQNKEDDQFEMIVEGKKAIVEFILAKDRIFLTHTEVPKSLGGKGVGSVLVKKVLDFIDENYDLPIVPLCPFVASFIKKHDNYKPMVFKGINLE